MDKVNKERALRNYSIQGFRRSSDAILEGGFSLENKLNFLSSSMSAVPAIRFGDAAISGGAKIGLGLKLQPTELRRVFSGMAAGGAALKTIGALGGALAISGISEMATSFLPSYAALPASAFGGYVAGRAAFSQLGINARFGGIIGAGLGIGFGIYSMIEGRNARRRAQRAQAEAIEEHSEQVISGISLFEKTLPLISDQERLLEEQYGINANLLNLNYAANAKTNFSTTEELNRREKKISGTFKVSLAQSGFGMAGLGWSIMGEAEEELWRERDLETWRYNVDQMRIDLKHREIFGEFKHRQSELLISRYQIENRIDYAKKILQRNLSALGSNPMARAEQQAKVSAGMSLADSLGSLAGIGTKRLEKKYYG